MFENYLSKEFQKRASGIMSHDLFDHLGEPRTVEEIADEDSRRGVAHPHYEFRCNNETFYDRGHGTIDESKSCNECIYLGSAPLNQFCGLRMNEIFLVKSKFHDSALTFPNREHDAELEEIGLIRVKDLVKLL